VKRVALSVFVVLGSMTAIAHAKPLPASQHQPALALNLPSLWLKVFSDGDDGYGVEAQLLVTGAKSTSDRLRFDWKSGGKVVGTGQCKAEYFELNHVLNGTCKLDKDAKAKGPVEIDVVYTDDEEQKDYLVAALKTDVKYWKNGSNTNWGILPDDLLSVAFAYNSRNNATFHKPLFLFWSTNNSLKADATFRCTVDGKKVPDFTAYLERVHGNGAESEIDSSYTTAKEHRSFWFEHYQLDPGFHYGSKNDFQGNDPSAVRWAIDSPGKWDCFLRVDGNPIREMLFTVNDQGMIEPSEMQKGARAVFTLPNVALIDMKIPHNHGVEKRIRPEAMRKSIGFGIPWPDSPQSKALQASFPPAVGLPE
jgi:hypothetical protein